ncbi:outer membrane protein assembly factor BamD [Hymenobacter sp. B81]|uniref:outer membrane protein assembly factor BamD n=1 Tax=Hymenobacter sp. B81 TaxID=3344878 RepID=UPI0037DCDFC6
MPAFRPRVLVLLLSLAVLGACSPYQKLLKSTNVNERYEAAVKYYEQGDYVKAETLLEPLIPLLKGRPEAEKAEFYFARANYEEGNYTLSSYYFQTFAETYPSSPYAEEALFMHAKSLFRDSPEYELDQTSTVTAIESIQAFLNRYPESKFRPETENMSNELQRKLEVKAFEAAKLYHSVRYYQSAVVAFNTYQQQYPASLYGEQAAFLKLASQHELAKESVEEKQRERFLEVVVFYQNFVDTYPQSKNLKAAEAMYDYAQKFLKEHPDPAAKTAPTQASTN